MIGTTLGPYRLDRELGSGGMGRVWSARVAGRVAGLAEGTLVAVKVVHPHLVESPGFFKRFLREAELGKAVVHPNVVRTFDCDAVFADGVQHHLLVMECVEGQTLRALLEELSRVPEELCRHVGREVAKGLAAIHAAGIVHRDLKPENVLITRDHAVKVMDLGVARLADEALRLSQTGVFVGSVEYAAPEQFRGDDVDGRADLHALGVVLYELATGTHPFRGDDFRGVMRRVLDETPRRCGELVPQLSPFLEEVVHTLLAKDRSRRFGGAGEVAEVLDAGERSSWWRERSAAIRAETRRPLRRIRIPRETAVHGRDAELAKLRALFDAARSGDGRVVLVEGEAGIGKSRLVDEFVGRLQREGEDLHFLFGSYPPGGAATVSGAFSTAYREQFGEEGSARWLPRTPLLVPAFDALLRGDATPDGSEPLAKDSLQTVFIHATRALAAERPTVVLIDDLHFAPEEGRALFAALALAVPGHRVLLVGTARPGLDPKWTADLSRLGHAATLPLGRLGPKDLVRLLADTLRSEHLAEDLAGRIAAKSDGNPFFVFEILRGLREGRFLTRRPDGTWVTTRILAEIEIPASVLDLVNARVADLVPQDRDVLDVASCLGFEFDPLLVGDVVGVPRIPLLKRLAQIERAHRLVRSAGQRYVFDHHQVQEALHRSLPEPLRAEYHAAIGDALERRSGAAEREPADLGGALCVDLADHFLAGGRGARVLRYLDAAMTHLEGAQLHEAAAGLASRVLGVPGLVEGTARCRLVNRRSDRLSHLGRHEEEGAALAEAIALADASGDARLRAEVRQRRAWYLLCTGRPGEAESALREALVAAATTGDRELEMTDGNLLGLALQDFGRSAEAVEQFRRSLAIARENRDPRAERVVVGNLGFALQDVGRFDEALEHHRRAVELSREAGDRCQESIALGNIGIVLPRLDRFAEAREALERQLSIARDIGYRRGEAMATGNLGFLLEDVGLLRDAQELHVRQRVLARETGYRRGEALATGNLGIVLHRLGRLAEARAAHTESLAIRREIADRWLEAYTLARLADLDDDEGDAAAALAGAGSAAAVQRECGRPVELADALVQLADLHRRAGAPDLARTALSEALPLLADQRRPAGTLLALAVAACLPHGDAAPALDALERAGEGRSAAKARFLLWQATGDRAHLAAAKRLLDHLVANAPEDCRDSMVRNVRLHREIAEAAAVAGL